MYEINLGRSAFIPGPHHGIHNMTADFSEALEEWDSFIMSLKHVCRLVGKRFTKERLIFTCFSQPAYRPFADLVRRFNSLVYDKRWNTAAHACVSLMELRVLQRAWSLDRFQGGQRVQQRDDEHACFTSRVVHSWHKQGGGRSLTSNLHHLSACLNITQHLTYTHHSPGVSQLEC